jgi:hypothetical protein
MSTFYVKKNGSGTHTTIQSAIYAASNGDIIDIEEGVFNENVELMGKSITLQGAGKDKTTIQGKATNDVFSGCSYYGGESVVTIPSPASLIVGKSVSGLTANTRVIAINGTQVSTSIATPATGNTNGKLATWADGSYTITLTTATAANLVGANWKVVGDGVDALVQSYNATTRVITLQSPTTKAQPSATAITIRKFNTAINVTQITSPSNSSGPASIMVTGISDGLVIKNLRAIGFENSSVGQEAAALFFTAGTAPGHTNFLIDNCWLTANGDCAVLNGSNPHLSNGTFQNCLIDGKTFQGSEPADVPSFSTYISQGVVQSIGASTSVIEFSDMRGIIVGRTMTSVGSLPSAATVTAISGNSVTINKVASVSVGTSIPCTFTLTAYAVPNVARNLFYIGDNKYPAVTNTKNITFKNNVVNGQTGATISATGSKNMFNSAVTIESEGGLVENNVIDGIFGSGESSLFANWAIRCRQPSIVVKDNVNKTSGGRQNSGFLVALGTSTNNVTINALLVETAQQAGDSFVEFSMQKDELAAMSAVSSHPVFSNQANWNMVSYVFKHNSSARRLVGSFKDFSSPKKSKLKPNMAIGDRFELHKIILATSPRDLLVLKRSEISGASGFDFNLVSDGPEEGNGGGGEQGPTPLQTIDFTQGSLPVGASVVSGTTPVMSNASAKFVADGAQINISSTFTYVAGATYKLRLYVKSANEQTSLGHSVSAYFYAPFRTPGNVSMQYGGGNPDLDLQLKVGSYIEASVVAGPQFNDGWPIIVQVQISPNGWEQNYLEITKIEIFEG